MPSLVRPIDGVFDSDHHASTLRRKVIRSFQLGPKYYLWDLPRYFSFRHSLGLSPWDGATLLNPFREFSRKVYQLLELPPGYDAALIRFRELRIKLTIPENRLKGLLGVWWSCRDIPGDAIECGSYQGATGLLLALLARQNKLEQNVLLLDTFSGMPTTSVYDAARSEGEFLPGDNQVAVIERQAAQLGIADRVKIHRGLFSDTFAALKDSPRKFSFAHIDANIYSSTLEACEFVMPRVNSHGAVVFDDYNGVCDLGARLAIDRYFRGRPERLKPLANSSAFAIKR